MQTTPQERHRRLGDIFARLCDAPESERGARLDAECADDAALRDQVERLLSRDSGSSAGSMDMPLPFRRERLLGEVGGEAFSEAFPEIRGYQITGVLGAGGMGVVYLAEQARPHREVALKVLRPELVSARLLRRLTNEAEVLARLDHTGIARVFESGTFARAGWGGDRAGGGEQPFFAMEVVRGEAITVYAEARRLPVRERLLMFVAVCDAVQHAHSKGVIHRDLKPSNVLITGDGRPKVLDFGIARLMESDRGATLETQVGQVVGTLQYMSPEQARGDPGTGRGASGGGGADTRSDVYSLGMILHELLAGSPAYDTSGKALHEAINLILTATPRRLGTVSTALRGDIDTVSAKAIAKDPAQRYQSVQELGAELRRVLAHEPVMARPPSAVYAARMFARRHPVPVTAAALIVVLAIAAGGLVFWQWRQARANLHRLDAVQAYLRVMLVGKDRVSAQHSPSVLDMINRAASGLEREFAGDPIGEAELRRTFGLTYDALGLPMRGAEHLTRAYELRAKALGPEADETLTVLEDLGHVQAQFMWSQPTDVKAGFVPAMEGLVKARERQFGAGNPRTLRAIAVLARAEGMPRTELQGQSHRRFEGVIAQMIKSIGPDDPLTLRTMRDFADVLNEECRFGEAIKTLEGVLEAERRKYGEMSSEYVDTLLMLARMAGEQGRPDEAERLARRAVELSDPKHFGNDYFLSLDARVRLGNALMESGRAAEAEQQFRPAFEASHERFFERYNDAAMQLIECLDRQGKYNDAEPLMELFWKEHVIAWGAFGHYQTLHLAWSARLAAEQPGRMADAEERLRRAQAVFDAAPPDQRASGALGWIHMTRGRMLMIRGELDAAEPVLAAALHEFADRRMGYPKNYRWSGGLVARWLVELNESQGRHERAQHWQTIADHWAVREVTGRLLVRVWDPDMAAAYLLPRYDEHVQAFGPDDPRTIDVARTLVELYRGCGRAEELARWLVVLQAAGAAPEDPVLDQEAGRPGSVDRPG